MTDRSALAAATLAVVLAVTLLVWARDTQPPAATNPVETATAAPTWAARIEVRSWTPIPTRTATPTATPLRYTQTRLARQTEAAVLRTATAIVGRWTVTPGMAAVEVGDAEDE